jgi:hypothetical protein
MKPGYIWRPSSDPADPNQVGPARRTAYALACLGLDVVSRSTLRSLLPDGSRRRLPEQTIRQHRERRVDPTRGVNRVTVKFQDALRAFDQQGWIRRGQKYVLVVERQALLDYALDGLRFMPKQLLQIETTIDQLNEELRTAQMTVAAIEQAERERHALMALMRNGTPGAKWSGRGSVRRVGPAGSGE